MSLVKKFAGVGSATMASRVLGFVREALIGAALGAGPVADAFYAAFRFPNLFRRIFAEGAFNTAFIPLFAKALEGGGQAEARDFAEKVLSVLIVSLLVISAVAMPVMHMNDYPADPPRETIRDSDRVMPGDGIAPLNQILRALHANGGRTVLSVELFNRAYWEKDALEVARTGLAKMKAAVGAALHSS